MARIFLSHAGHESGKERTGKEPDTGSGVSCERFFRTRRKSLAAFVSVIPIIAICIAASLPLSGCGKAVETEPEEEQVAVGEGMGGTGEAEMPQWSVTEKAGIVEIAYGSGNDYPQYIALHLDSGYLRMNYGPGSGWGTSVIILPSFWDGGDYYQGAPVTCAWKNEGSDLLVSFKGTVSSLHAVGELRFKPPAQNALTATVSVAVEGDADLDRRAGEAFKPVMLSSMHVSASRWDAQTAYVESQSFQIPVDQWMIKPPVTGKVFGLVGGMSDWQRERSNLPAPTVEAVLGEAMQVTGWVTASSDPNDDNIGFWAATDHILRSWQYGLTAKP